MLPVKSARRLRFSNAHVEPTQRSVAFSATSWMHAWKEDDEYAKEASVIALCSQGTLRASNRSVTNLAMLPSLSLLGSSVESFALSVLRYGESSPVHVKRIGPRLEISSRTSCSPTATWKLSTFPHVS